MLLKPRPSAFEIFVRERVKYGVIMGWGDFSGKKYNNGIYIGRV